MKENMVIVVVAKEKKFWNKIVGKYKIKHVQRS